MTSLEKAIILGTYFLPLNTHKKQKKSIHAPLPSTCIGMFQFMQKSVFDHNTCTLSLSPLTGAVDVH